MLGALLELRTSANGCELKKIYNNSFYIGAALNARQLGSGPDADPVGAAIVIRQYNTISPENVLKWDSVHPSPGEFDFSLADEYVRFGHTHGMYTIGHNLVWHQQTPAWVFTESGLPAMADLLLERMRAHILTVMRRYRGRIGAWDVVNEVVGDDGSLRASDWLNGVGDYYIEAAFRFAREADPGAQLYYNDYLLEFEPKRTAALALVRALWNKGLIDGVGLQGHYGLDTPTATEVRETIDLFSDIGVKVAISELDIDLLPAAWFCLDRPGGVCHSGDNDEAVQKLDPYGRTGRLSPDVARLEAQRFSDLFAVFLSRQEVISRVTFWGVTDKDSWLNSWPVDNRTAFPLPFGRDYRPKPPFDALVGLCDQR